MAERRSVEAKKYSTVITLSIVAKRNLFFSVTLPSVFFRVLIRKRPLVIGVANFFNKEIVQQRNINSYKL